VPKEEGKGEEKGKKGGGLRAHLFDLIRRIYTLSMVVRQLGKAREKRKKRSVLALIEYSLVYAKVSVASLLSLGKEKEKEKEGLCRALRERTGHFFWGGGGEGLIHFRAV